MGFRIEFDGDAAAFLGKLRTTPAAVFDKPYKGYMLFLAGAGDQDVCEWIARNTIQLDSLTGPDIAYAVFAKRFLVKLRTPPSYRAGPLRSPRVLGEVDSEKVVGGSWQVQKLVKSGRWGWVVEGDELAAVTYAVDELARGLGVLDKLPCIVTLDAIPLKEMNVIRLTSAVTENLLTVLRRTLAKLHKTPGFVNLDARIANLLNLYKKIENAKEKQAVLQRELDLSESSLALIESTGPVSAADMSEIGRRLREAEAALQNTSLRNFRFALSGHRKGKPTSEDAVLPGLEAERLQLILRAAERAHQDLWTLKRTVQSLESANSDSEPGRSVRLQLIGAKHVTRLLGQNPFGDATTSIADVHQVVRALEELRARSLADILALLPTEKALLESLETSRKRSHVEKLQQTKERIASLSSRIDEAKSNPEAAVEAARSRYETAVHAYLSEHPPSFSAAMSQSLREMKLADYSTNIQGRAIELVAGMFEPGFLLKFWQAVAG